MFGTDLLTANERRAAYGVVPEKINLERLKPVMERLLCLLEWRDYSKTPCKDSEIAMEMLRVAKTGDVSGVRGALKQAVVHQNSPAVAAANILEYATLLLAQDWREDVASDADVSIAISVLQTALRSVFAFRDCTLGIGSGAVLTTPAPGEPHMLGAAILSEILSEAGVDVSTNTFKTPAALEEWVSRHWVDAVTLHLSAVYLHENIASGLPRLIAGIRAKSENPAVRIAVQDPYAFGNLRSCTVLGADTTSKTAVALAPRLLRWMRDGAWTALGTTAAVG